MLESRRNRHNMHPVLASPKWQRCSILRRIVFSRSKSQLHRFFWAVLFTISFLSSGCNQGKENSTDPGSIQTEKKNTENSPKETPIWFDRTEASGINAICQNGGEAGIRTMLETLGGGLGAGDFDLDGNIDLFINGGGTISSEQVISGEQSFHYRNLGDWNFQAVREPSGIDTSSLYSHGCQLGDLDNDGFCDLIVTGYRGILVFRNQGDGRFELMPQTGIATDQWATSAALADFNQDGSLDLYVCNYLDWNFKNHQVCMGANQAKDVCSPRSYDGLVDDLFTSNNDWTFTRDGIQKGITHSGKGLGVVAADFDLDDDVDIYVANDVTNNLLYINDGTGAFDEQGEIAGVSTGEGTIPNGSMGVEVCDFNLDQIPDIGVANFESEDFALYRQKILNSNSFYVLESKKAKLTAVSQKFVGWGTVFTDVDGDLDEDLIINNGHLSYAPNSGDPMQQLPIHFENRNGEFINRIGSGDYFQKLHHGRGLLAADLDRDGDPDLIFGNVGENIAILENRSEPSAESRQVPIFVIGTKMNRDGIGIPLEISSRQKKIIKLLRGGGSYLCGNHRTQLVPTFEAEIYLKTGAKKVEIKQSGQPIFWIEP